jgi:hypothetical protein
VLRRYSDRKSFGRNITDGNRTPTRRAAPEDDVHVEEKQ